MRWKNLGADTGALLGVTFSTQANAQQGDCPEPVELERRLSPWWRSGSAGSGA
jgi:hypothetical protein